MLDEEFYIAKMPATRPADYYLSFKGGSIFIDFNRVGNQQISLKRISFDGYGCCDLNNALPLTEEDSILFKEIIKANISDQNALSQLVSKAIQINKHLIWDDALEHYDLI
jgi:hypothetical protein